MNKLRTLELLMEIAAWNAYRKENPYWTPNLSGVNLSDANLSDANLSDANLIYANLSDANLSDANLSDANLIYAKLSNAKLSNANLSNANLSSANLSNAYLIYAKLSNAKLSNANLNRTNLSSAFGLLSSSDWLKENFDTYHGRGYIVFKEVDLYKSTPPKWEYKGGNTLAETVNPNRTDDCGCGINFATLTWIKKKNVRPDLVIWKCLLTWEALADTVVPYNTNGKARCQSLQLLERIQ